MIFAVLMIAAIITGCEISNQKAVTTGKNAYSLSQQQETQKEEHKEEIVALTQDKKMTGLYMITQIDTQENLLTFYNMQNKKNVSYTYTGGTCFYDKFHALTTQETMEVGSLVNIEISNVTKALTKVNVSDQTWEKTQVKDYTIDDTNHVFTIGDTHYAYSKNTKYFSDDGQIASDELTDKDVLRVFGIDKQILSVTVVTGHGMLTLTNTKNFDQGWLGLYGEGKTSYYQIRENMQIELPEGDYQLTASNHGYGAQSNLTITRNETTNIDLEEIKNATPKNCMITFQAIEPSTTVYLDGQKIDISQPIEVQYGTHSIAAYADGYDTWSRKLIVNSAQATIPISLTKESEKSDTAKSNTQSSSQTAAAGGDTSNHTSSSSNTNNQTGVNTPAPAASTQAASTQATGSTQAANHATDSYLNTLSGIIDTLTNDSKKSSEE